MLTASTRTVTRCCNILATTAATVAATVVVTFATILLQSQLLQQFEQM